MRHTCHVMIAVCVAALVCAAPPSAACVGDCNGDAAVTIDELVRAVDIALGATGIATCDALDNDRDGQVSIDELVRAVGKALGGCGLGSASEVVLTTGAHQVDELDLRSGALTTTVPPTRGLPTGQVCALRDGSGSYVVGDETGAPVSGWSIYSPDGTFVTKLPLGLAQDGQIHGGTPAGCAVDASGRVFGSAVGATGGADGQLWVFFPPDYATGCLLDATLRSPGALAIDADGAVYVPESVPGGAVLRYGPSFPANPNECELSAGAPQAANSVFIAPTGDAVPSAIAASPGGAWFVAYLGSTDRSLAGIRRYDATGAFVGDVLSAGGGDPIGLAFAASGALYYADRGLDALTGQAVPGKGTLRKLDLASGNTATPELVARGLTDPAGVGIAPSHVNEWLTLGGSLRRTFFNPRERKITPAAADRLIPKWRYLTSGMISAQPAVVSLDLPEGPTRVVIVPSWDQHVYALRTENGTRVWQFEMDPQPGTFYPYSGSPTVAWVDGHPRVFVPGGETLYCLDALDGHELWRFTAGSGCTTCTARQERNEIESTPAVANGLVIAGMDTNDGTPGKGGVFAVRADDGRLAWWFDLVTSTTCVPFATDAISKFDGFHTAEQLGLPADFFATRPGCNFDRTGVGCGNVWSSAAVDARRGLFYTVSSNCDTDDDPNTPPPPPPAPPYEEAIFAVHIADGTPAWVWRPRDEDPDDFDFGAVPNLFEVEIGGAVRDVIGVGGKDGTYYLLDRDGTNALTGIVEPYWRRQVVPGGPAGGVIGSASVDDESIVFATAPGFDPLNPQKPTVHALDPGTGSVLWESGEVDSSFGPTMGVPGLAFTGSTPRPDVNIFRRSDGTLLTSLLASGVASGVASGATIVDGELFVGAGVGAYNSGSSAATEANRDTPLFAFCVEGAPGCTENTCDDHDPCTYDYRDRSGACATEPSADGLDCRLNSVRGTCQQGACVVMGVGATPTPGEG